MTADPTERRGIGFVNAKGGAGATTAAVVAADVANRSGHEVVLVDLTGDIAAILGCSSELPGVSDSLQRRSDPTGYFVDLRLASEASTVNGAPRPALRMLPRGTGALPGPEAFAWYAMWSQLDDYRALIVADAGQGIHAIEMLRHAPLRKSLVTTTCSQSVTRATSLRTGVHDVVVREQPGTVRNRSDAENDIGRKAAAGIPWNRAIARRADAGMLLSCSQTAPEFADHVTAVAQNAAGCTDERAGLTVTPAGATAIEALALASHLDGQCGCPAIPCEGGTISVDAYQLAWIKRCCASVMDREDVTMHTDDLRELGHLSLGGALGMASAAKGFARQVAMATDMIGADKLDEAERLVAHAEMEAHRRDVTLNSRTL